jgi:hypothetical protein
VREARVQDRDRGGGAALRRRRSHKSQVLSHNEIPGSCLGNSFNNRVVFGLGSC